MVSLMNEEKETVKIMTKQGKVITLTISQKTETHLFGTDKFSKDVILPINDIDRMFPMEESP